MSILWPPMLAALRHVEQWAVFPQVSQEKSQEALREAPGLFTEPGGGMPNTSRNGL